MDYKIFTHTNKDAEPIFVFDMHGVVVEPNTTYTVPDKFRKIEVAKYGIHTYSDPYFGLYDLLWSTGRTLQRNTTYIACVNGFDEYDHEFIDSEIFGVAYKTNRRISTIAYKKLKIIGRPVLINVHAMYSSFVKNGMQIRFEYGYSFELWMQTHGDVTRPLLEKYIEEQR